MHKVEKDGQILYAHLESWTLFAGPVTGDCLCKNPPSDSMYSVQILAYSLQSFKIQIS